MFNSIKESLYFSRMKLLFYKGIVDKKIIPFDDDFKQYGRKRFDLLATMPLIIRTAQNSKNQKFIEELNEFIKLIQYNEEEIYKELKK